MSAALKIFDKNLGKERKLVHEIKLVSERVTVRDVIRRRIEAEAKALQEQLAKPAPDSLATFAGNNLVLPGFVESILNGNRTYGAVRQTKPKPVTRIDVEAQHDLACEAFQKNSFIMLFDDRQVGGLDDLLTVRENSTATFVRLTPLVGG